jgi:hypothetical protein
MVRDFAHDAFSHGICPDVQSDACHLVGAAQDMVVEFGLLKGGAKSSAVLEGALLFEAAYEIEQVTLLRESLGEKMDVIRHEAVSVDGEFMER